MSLRGMPCLKWPIGPPVTAPSPHGDDRRGKMTPIKAPTPRPDRTVLRRLLVLRDVNLPVFVLRDNRHVVASDDLLVVQLLEDVVIGFGVLFRVVDTDEHEQLLVGHSTPFRWFRRADYGGKASDVVRSQHRQLRGRPVSSLSAHAGQVPHVSPRRRERRLWILSRYADVSSRSRGLADVHERELHATLDIPRLAGPFDGPQLID